MRDEIIKKLAEVKSISIEEATAIVTKVAREYYKEMLSWGSK